MKMAEQNISGVKLERMRQDAVKKMKLQWKLIPVDVYKRQAKANVDRLLKMDEEQKKEQEKDHGQR